VITEPTVLLLNATSREFEVDHLMDFDPDTTDADNSAVFAGRSCYQSFGKSYAPTAADADYIASTVHSAEHFSVIEHASAAFYITGVSRSLTHELVRHRQLSYSQLSQRYVDSSEIDWVCPIEYLADPNAQEVLATQFDLARESYQALTEYGMRKLAEQGVVGTEARKRARQSARAVLPNATETRLVISGNHRAWLEALGKRWAPGAEPEIRRLFGEYLLPRLTELAPHIYATVPDDPALTGVPTVGRDGLVWLDGMLYRVVNDHIEIVKAGDRT
jgi:thymidylate synthase (FAD)